MHTRSDVAVGSDVTFRSAEAGNNAKVTVNNLCDFSCEENNGKIQQLVNRTVKHQTRRHAVPVSVVNTRKLLSQKPHAIRKRLSTVVMKQLERSRTF